MATTAATNFNPDFSFEQEYLDKGYKYICGIDEVGRGTLAGPVVAAAVILDAANIPAGLHDSKKLSAAKREALFKQIMKSAVVSVASINNAVIDKINILQATLRAMTEAASGLSQPADFHLIDGNKVPTALRGQGACIVKGDSRSLSVAAASIVAKVTRDRMMEQAALIYPGYGFEEHAGYGTPNHLAAISQLGPCPIHRMTFKPLRKS